MVASVPELVKRIFSIEAMRLTSSRASATSGGLGAAKEVPRAACSRIASTTAGWAWPATSAV